MADLSQLESALVKADAAGDTQSASVLAREIRSMRQAAPAQPPQQEESIQTSIVGGAVEPNLALGSSMVAGPVSGLAGLVGTVLPGHEGQGADWTRKVGQALTYQPRTQGGQRAMQAISYPFEKLAEGADYAGGAVTDVTGSPAAGTAVNTAIQAVPAYLGGRAIPTTPRNQTTLGRRVDRIEGTEGARRSQNAVRDQTLTDAQELGYVLPPSEVRGNTGVGPAINRRLESISGKAALDQEAAIRNQGLTNAVARREGSLGPNEPLTPGNLEGARDRLAQPYRDVEALPQQPLTSPPFGTAAETLAELREARRKAKLHYKHYDRTQDPAALSLAEGHSKKAQQLEQTIDAVAQQSGQPELLKALRDARQGLAKNYDVERVLNLGSGDASARLFGSALDRGAPMTGDLATTGKFAEAFPRVNRDASSIPTPGVSKSEALASAVLATGGAAAGGAPGLLAGGLPLLSGPMRNLILSPAYQRLMAKPKYRDPSLTRGAADMYADPRVNALVRAIAPTAYVEQK